MSDKIFEVPGEHSGGYIRDIVTMLLPSFVHANEVLLKRKGNKNIIHIKKCN